MIAINETQWGWDEKKVIIWECFEVRKENGVLEKQRRQVYAKSRKWWEEVRADHSR